MSRWWFSDLTRALNCYFRALRLGGVLRSPQATPSGLQMTPPSLPGTENPGKHSSPDFILIFICVARCIVFQRTCYLVRTMHIPKRRRQNSLLLMQIWSWLSFFVAYIQYKEEANANEKVRLGKSYIQGGSECEWKGKVRQIRLVTVLCNTTENFAIPFKSDFINDMTCNLWCKYVQTRNLSY